MPRTITCHEPASQKAGSSAHEDMQITVNSESVPAQNIGPDLRNQAHSAYVSGSQVLYCTVMYSTSGCSLARGPQERGFPSHKIDIGADC